MTEPQEYYDYPYKHPNNCDNCSRDKKIEVDWDNDGHKYETIVCPAVVGMREPAPMAESIAGSLSAAAEEEGEVRRV